MTPVEAIHISLNSIEESLAEAITAAFSSVEAAVAQTTAIDQLRTETNERLDNQNKSTKDLAAEVTSLRSECSEMIGLMRNFITDTNKLRSEVREKLRAANG